MEFSVRIVTPKGVYKTLKTEILNVVSTNGQLGILANHMPIVASLTISSFTTVESDGRHTYAISGGILYFNDNLATLLTDAIERSDEIDVARAKLAKEKAEALLAAQETEEDDLKKAEVALKRAINRLKVAS